MCFAFLPHIGQTSSSPTGSSIITREVACAYSLTLSSHSLSPHQHAFTKLPSSQRFLISSSEEAVFMRSSRILRDFETLHGKSFEESLRKLLPRELIEPFSELTNIPLDKKVDEINKSERKTLLNTLKKLTLHIKSFRPIDEAIVTRGGVNVREINPKTVQSRLCNGLFLAGEIIDVDGYTGGFNLQIAFSTGALAGTSSVDFVKII